MPATPSPDENRNPDRPLLLVPGRAQPPQNLQVQLRRCPVDKKGRFAAEGSSYEWNYDLNGHRMDETRTDSAFLLLHQGDISSGVTNFVLTLPPGTTPLFLDYDGFHPRPSKFGKNVVFMDGHVAPLTATGDD